ncbi:MAG: hypothetical protein ACI9XC_002102 [Gammaproteobacteria bacterium]|jgi:hypothetical protein
MYCDEEKSQDALLIHTARNNPKSLQYLLSAGFIANPADISTKS